MVDVVRAQTMNRLVTFVLVCCLLATWTPCRAEAVWHFVYAAARKDIPFLQMLPHRFQRGESTLVLMRELKKDPEREAPLTGHFVAKDEHVVKLVQIMRLANTRADSITDRTLPELLERKGQEISFTASNTYAEGPVEERNIVRVNTAAIVLTHTRDEHGSITFHDVLVCTFEVDGQKRHVVLAIGTHQIPL
jgi:hypothetical protein